MPQPLTYLVDDTARTFGTVRVGHAEAFLRADDEAALTELLHHPRAAALGLRRLAPTVLVSTTPLDVLLPAAARARRGAAGRGHRRHRARRAAPTGGGPAPARRPRGRADAAPARRALAQVVTAIRAGDRAAASRRPRPSAALTPIGSLAALREAVEAGAHRADRLRRQPRHRHRAARRPGPVEGGWLTARDHRGRRRAHVRRPPDHGREGRWIARPVDSRRGFRPVRRGVGGAAQRRARRRRRARGAPRRPRLAAAAGAPTATAAAAAVPARAAAGLRGVGRRRHPGRGRRAQRAAGAAPDHPADRRPRPGDDLHIHVATKAASVADLLVGESLLGLANLVCDLGPTRLGVCAADAVHQRLRRHLAQPVAPLLLRPLLLARQRRGLPRPAEARVAGPVGCTGCTP